MIEIRNSPIRPILLAAPLALVVACAAHHTSAPASSVTTAANIGQRLPSEPEPFRGRLLSVDVDTFNANCDASLDKARRLIALLKEEKAKTADPYAVIDLYDEANGAVNSAAEVADIVFSAHPDKAHRDAADKCTEKAESLATKMNLDRGVYDALATINLAGLDSETRYFVATELHYFRREGVDRDDATRAKVQQLEDELTKIRQAFAKNINTDTRRVAFDPSDLAGLPADYVAKHPVGADGKVVVTTDYPDFFPFMEYATSSAAREKLYRAFKHRAYPANMTVLSGLLQKRQELATLLGYPNFAAREMASKMIRTPQAARSFIDKIVAASGRRAASDYELLLAEARKADPRARAVNRWDVAYLENRVRDSQLSFDPASVRPYFEFSRVKAGLVDLAATLFDLNFKPVVGSPVWSPDVEVYDVYDRAALLGRIYLDLHPRPNKYKHAAQFNLAGGKRSYRLPEGVLMCNFPRDGELLTHEEVKTFFHEFGHLIQHTLAGRARWENTDHIRERDFVEAPSQFLEEWVDDAATLQRFATHYKTNEPIPAKLVEQMVRAENFGRGLDVRRQMVLAAVSLEYYTRDARQLDTTKLYDAIEREYLPYPDVSDVYEQTSFGHLNDYSSNYYTYMWSLVIAKDLLAPFKSAGMLDHDTAMRYRRSVLELCGTRPPADSVKEFLGRPFRFDAYEHWLNGQS